MQLCRNRCCREVSFICSNGSNSQSSQSPDVCSPVGLAPLPIVAPLASSPVDVQHQPLAGVSPEPHVHELTSVSPKSPLHIAFDTKLPDSPSIESHTSSQHSFTTITSPQDSNWDHPFQGDVLAVKLPDSPTSEHALSPVQEPPPASYASDQTGHHNSEIEVMLVCRSLVTDPYYDSQRYRGLCRLPQDARKLYWRWIAKRGG